GSFLRSFTWGNARQLEAAARELLAELARQAPLLPGAGQLAFVDIDSMQRRVYGHSKQGAAFGHTKISGKTVLVRGLNTLAAAVPEDAWTPIRYPRAIWDDQLRAWISDAEIAEVPYTAFASKKGQAVTARLIVRRVRDLAKTAEGQGELFPAWRYHPVFSDSP